MCSSIYMMVLSFHLAKSAIIYLQPIKHYLKTHTRIHISLLSVLHEIKPYRLLDVWSMHQPLIMKTHLTLFFEMENQSNCLGLFKWQMLPSILSLSWLDSAHIECKVIYIMHTFMAYSIIRWGGRSVICVISPVTQTLWHHVRQMIEKMDRTLCSSVDEWFWVWHLTSIKQKH